MNPRLVILDEATSSLDTQTEALIQKALRNLLSGRTSIIIAHRLSTVVDCDQIVVLEQGQILQQGSHRELITDQAGKYYQLCQKQFGLKVKPISADSTTAHPAHDRNDYPSPVSLQDLKTPSRRLS